MTKTVLISLFLFVFLFFSNTPSVYASPDVIELWVNGFTNTTNDWTEVGASPYLDAIDYSTNYFWGSVADGWSEGQFDFTDSGVSGSITSVEICIYTTQANTDNGQIDVYVTNSTAEYNAGQIIPDNGMSWSWKNTTVTTILPTWSEIDGAQLRVVAQRIGGPDIIYVDAALIRVVYTAGAESYQYTSEDKLNLYETQTNLMTYQRSGSDLLNLYEDSVRQINVSFFTSDFLNLYSLAEKITGQAYERAVEDILNLFSSITRQINITVSTSDFLSLLSSISEQFGWNLNLSDLLNLDESLTVLRNIIRTTSDSLSLFGSVVRDIAKTVTDSLSLFDSVSRHISKELSDLLQLLSKTERLITVGFNLSDLLNLLHEITSQYTSAAEEEYTGGTGVPYVPSPGLPRLIFWMTTLRNTLTTYPLYIVQLPIMIQGKFITLTVTPILIIVPLLIAIGIIIYRSRGEIIELVTEEE